MRPAVFLDRDGTINADRPDYVKNWGEFQFLPRALDALRMLAKLDAEVIVVTNQSAIGRGKTSQGEVDDLHRRMIAAIEAEGGRVTAVYFCPHTPSDGCNCRKPQPGLLLEAARKHDVDLPRSVLAGDRASDIAAARAAGCAAIRIGTEEGQPADDVPVVSDLYEAVPRIQRTLGSP